MEKVQILGNIYVEQLSTEYRKGDVVEVPKIIAERHVKTGLMKILKSRSKPVSDSSVKLK